MTDALQGVMDAITELEKAKTILEGLMDDDGKNGLSPSMYQLGSTQYFQCRCGTPVHYGDHYCRNCGRGIRWDG